MDVFRIFSIAAALLVYTSVYAQNVDQAPTSFVEVVSGCTTEGPNCVNIRSGPGTDFRSIRTIRKGAVLEVDSVTVRDNHAWYHIKQDEQLRYPERVSSEWYIASEFTRMHIVGRERIAPTEDAKGKLIVIQLKKQKLTAYQDGVVFMSAAVSTGITGTPTPRGTFTIFKKKPSRYMQGPLPYISEKYFDLPGVPWTMYFTKEGAAIHGTYWHTAFGKPHSNGCINLPVDLAERIYHWAPIGTTVQVRD